MRDEEDFKPTTTEILPDGVREGEVEGALNTREGVQKMGGVISWERFLTLQGAKRRAVGC